MFEKLNKTRTIMDGVNLDGMKYRKLKELAGKKLSCKGFFFSNGKFGKQVVVVTDECLVNMPERAVAQFDEIANNKEMLEAVLNGKLVISVESEVVTRQGTTTTYELQDA